MGKFCEHGRQRRLNFFSFAHHAHVDSRPFGGWNEARTKWRWSISAPVPRRGWHLWFRGLPNSANDMPCIDIDTMCPKARPWLSRNSTAVTAVGVTPLFVCRRITFYNSVSFFCVPLMTGLYEYWVRYRLYPVSSLWKTRVRQRVERMLLLSSMSQGLSRSRSRRNRSRGDAEALVFRPPIWVSRIRGWRAVFAQFIHHDFDSPAPRVRSLRLFGPWFHEVFTGFVVLFSSAPTLRSFVKGNVSYTASAGLAEIKY